MGRTSTGAWTVYESLKIELTYLLKHNYFKKGRLASGDPEWSNPHGKKLGSIGLICCYGSEDSEKFIVLKYTITDRSGKKTALNYRVWLIEVDSNLGKGKVLYLNVLRPVSDAEYYIKRMTQIFLKAEKHTKTYFITTANSLLSSRGITKIIGELTSI
jgi:hypothetical protein